MSWLARSITNTLKLDGVDNRDSNDDVFDLNEDHSKDEDSTIDAKTPPKQQHINKDSSWSQTASPRGVKDDLSELTKTLNRGFWGATSFPAPPVRTLQTPRGIRSSKPGLNFGSESESDPVGIVGIRNDFAEIGGKFWTGVSMISNNIAVIDITKMASNFSAIGIGE